jgi:glutathione S-transferase
MYRLYSAPNTYAMSAQAVLEEIGASYEVITVSLFSQTPDPEFLAASPHGRVPALVDEHGMTCETGAIALYLAERHPEAGLAIPSSDPRRARFLQWLFYLSSTLQPDVILQFHPEFYFADAQNQRRLQAASLGRLAKVLTTLDAALAPGPYFFGDQLTVCDLCLALQAIWPEIYPRPLDDYPNLKRSVEAIVQRPAVAKVIAQHRDERARQG